MNTVNQRIKPIHWLLERTESAVDLHEIKILEAHALSRYECSATIPTIGCEIEVKWSSLFPETAEGFFGPRNEQGELTRRHMQLSTAEQRMFNEIWQMQDDCMRPLYEATENAGIPRGGDAYWEFANAPAYHWKTLASEVSLLFQCGLIPSGHEHSLHITLGGIENKTGGPAYIISALELLHGSANRILEATRTNLKMSGTSWGRRGKDGLRSRSSDVLSFGQQHGVEMRTLSTNSSAHATDSLRSAQILGSILLAYRSRESNAHSEVAKLWLPFRNALNTLWQETGLPIQSWGAPHSNAALWEQWTHCIESKNQAYSASRYCVDSIEDYINQAEQLLDL